MMAGTSVRLVSPPVPKSLAASDVLGHPFRAKMVGAGGLTITGLVPGSWQGLGFRWGARFLP